MQINYSNNQLFELEKLINDSYDNMQLIDDPIRYKKLIDGLSIVIELLNDGLLQITYKKNNEWCVHQWLKKAILLYFKTHNASIINADFTQFYDKIPLKFPSNNLINNSTNDELLINNFSKYIINKNIRIVPGAIIRTGSYINNNSILMPSFINIGAYIGSNVMIDTWATIGSCAYIGNNVHISGGAGIGGVLEPLQDNPTIIEDNCFIGARSEIVEGVIVEEGSVISMGVYIGKSTKIYDRINKTISYGKIPAYSVVVSGSIPSTDGSHSVYAAIIMKKVDALTRSKISINQLLRE